MKNNMIEIILFKIYCFFFDHNWSNWVDKVHIKNWLTIEEKNSRACKRCYKRDFKEWKPQQLRLVKRNNSKIAKGLAKGIIGEIYEVRFISTTSPKIAY